MSLSRQEEEKATPFPPAGVEQAGVIPAARQGLALICERIGEIRSAFIAIRPDSVQTLKPDTTWPKSGSVSEQLVNTARLAFSSGAPVECGSHSIRVGEPSTARQVACPVRFEGELLAVLAVEAEPGSGGRRELLEEVRWGAAWTGLLLSRPPANAAPDPGRRLAKLAAAGSLKLAAHMAATSLAADHQCQRVWIGLRNGADFEVAALSNSVDFDRRTNLVTGARLAMLECLRLETPVQYPGTGKDNAQDVRFHEAHARLAEQTGQGTLYSTPLRGPDGVFGVITADTEIEGGFGDRSRRELDTQAAWIAPILQLIQQRDQGPLARARIRAASWFARFHGPGQPWPKLAVLAGLAVILTLLFSQGTFRVTANARIEGAIQRAVVAPFDGYVYTARVRAGHQVAAGELMAELDATDLRLELRKNQGEHTEIEKQLRKAQANRDHAQARILKAQMEQAAARIELLREQLKRSRLTAPIDGLVITGDLSRSLGSPVSRGDVLFELAPLDQYRVALEVDGRDIHWVRPGQQGELVLASVPGESLPLTVTQISRVSSEHGQAGGFRVEAALRDRLDSLRPGMQGIGKIQVGERRLLWVWTRSLVEWLQFQFWAWTP